MIFNIDIYLVYSPWAEYFQPFHFEEKVGNWFS